MIMRDEVHQRRARQRGMPYVLTPTETGYSYRRHDDGGSLGLSAVTSASTDPIQTPFIVGTDTCGFTTGSAITCGVGYQCTNVGDHRGCCVDDADDCISSVYTSCIDYSMMPNAGLCGPKTLCCPATQAFCFSYAFSTSDQPDATFTYVQCATTAGFGEMYPYPPELITETSDSGSAPSSTEGNLSVQPVKTGSSSSSAPSGAITGAAVGGVVLVILIITGIVLFTRRRRQQRAERLQSLEAPDAKPASFEPPSDKAKPLDKNKIKLVRGTLFTIQEQSSPSSPSVSPLSPPQASDNKRTRPQNPGPNWPLGPRRPISPRNPLSSHPVKLEKGQSSNFITNDVSPRNREPRVPTLLAPPTRNPKTSRGLTPATTGSPTTAETQSPRLSYVPVSPLDKVFGDEVNQRLSSLGQRAESSHPSLPLLNIAMVGARKQAGTSQLEHDHDPVSPVSPLDDEDIEAHDQRISFVSAPSEAPGDRYLSDDETLGEGVVSPISPHHVNKHVESGEVSPMSVSPTESRRGSVV
ncbi:hypothetical protein F5Y16DRAFT_237000 [Xylariaceae sp. FL0255]|nr:hypothetical protein F5Y16DRAFT_237000 [Xylariaceae sp. FL0255]